MQRRLVREPEARDYLGSISHGAFWKLRAEGRIPVIRLGRSAYYDLADLDRFVERLKQEQGVGV